MKQFIEKYGLEIVGCLSGFDRLVFRATPRKLQACQFDRERKILVAKGMEQYLWAEDIYFKHFGAHVEKISERVKEAFRKPFEEQKRPFTYLRDPKVDKEELARHIAAQDGISSGLICAFSTMEMGPTFAYVRSRIVPKLRPCNVLYAYQIHPELGFMYSRIQTWFPFPIQVGINGREWLARRMEQEKLRYEKLNNTFTFLEDYPRAQQLMDEQLKTDWPALLDSFGRQLNPLHEEIFADYRTDNYWTAYQVEWATDVTFRDPKMLQRLMPLWTRHAVENFGCTDVLRFFGKRLTQAGKIPANFNADLKANLKQYREGQRVKFYLNGNSAKFYDKAPNVARLSETTTQEVSIFRTYRPKEGGDPADLKWRPMRKGIADLHRRAEVSQQINDRVIDALASVDDSRRLEELIAKIQKPQTWKDRRVRALYPLGEDHALLEAINRGEFLINGVRNRDLQAILYHKPAESPAEQRRRSAAVSRKIRMLRAHHILHKVPKTHRYQVPPEARTMLVAILTSAKTSLQQINRLNGKAA